MSGLPIFFYLNLLHFIDNEVIPSHDLTNENYESSPFFSIHGGPT